MQGEFKIEKGVLGSFDLTRALQTGGAQSSGRTVFNELTGQGVYDKGAVQIAQRHHDGRRDERRRQPRYRRQRRACRAAWRPT